MNRKNLSFATSALTLIMIAGCAKKTPPPPVAPPPPPPAPTASISANPSSLQKGGSTQLTWRTENANDVSIEGIGAVDTNGSKTVSPTESTSYRVIAKGPGGSQDAVARVTVTEPPPPPVAETPSLSDEQWWAQNVQDIYFDYDSYSIRPDAQQLPKGGRAVGPARKAAAQPDNGDRLRRQQSGALALAAQTLGQQSQFHRR